jgi:hypothetical protein
MEGDEQYRLASRRGGNFRAAQARVVDAWFERRTGRIAIQLSSGVEISFSPRDAEGLDQASSTELDHIEISTSGYGIYFPRLDIDLHLTGLLAGHLGSDRWLAARRQAMRGQTKLRPRSQKRKAAAAKAETKLARKEKWGGLRAIPGGLLSSRSPERGNSKIEKDGDYQGSYQEHPVIRSVDPTGAHAPKIWRKNDDGEKEEEPCNFEPDDSANASKGAQEPTHAADNRSAGLVCHSAGNSPRIARTNFRVYSGLRRINGSRTGARGESLSGNTSGDSYSDSQGPADGLWSHPIYDGSSDAG